MINEIKQFDDEDNSAFQERKLAYQFITQCKNNENDYINYDDEQKHLDRYEFTNLLETIFTTKIDEEKISVTLKKIEKENREINDAIENKVSKKPKVFYGRKDLLAKCNEWCHNEDVSYTNLWLNGQPGYGKTAFAIELSSRIAEWYGKENVVLFLCDATDDITRYARSIFKYITYKILFCDKDLIDEEIIDFINEKNFSNRTAKEVFDKLVYPLLEKRRNMNKPFYLIVDSIGEMITEERNTLLDLLNRLVSLTGLKIIITSYNTPERDSEWNRKSYKLSLNNQEENKKDIEEFLTNSEKSLSKDEITQIVEKSEGSFLYSVYLKDDFELSGKVEISLVPEGLQALYANILKREYTDEVYYDEKIRPILAILLVVKTFISTIDICKILDKKQNDFDEKLLPTFFYEKRDENCRKIKLFNQSFATFLSNHENQYYVDKKAGEEYIAQYLKKNPNEIITSEYFKYYGFEHIFEFIESSNDSSILNSILNNNHSEILSKLETDFYNIFMKKKNNSLKVITNLSDEKARRIIITTYRKGIRLSEIDKDPLCELLRILREKFNDDFRATMLEGERLEHFNRKDAAKEKFEQCLKIAEKEAKENPSSWIKRKKGLAHNRLGHLYKNKFKDMSQAKNHYKAAYSLFCEINNMNDEAYEKNQLEYKKDFAISNARMGDIAFSNCRIIRKKTLEAIKNYYKNCFDLCRNLVERNKSGAKRELAMSYRRLGDIYIYESYSEAYKYYIESARLLSEVASFSDSRGILNTIIDECGTTYLDSREFIDCKIKITFPPEHRDPDYHREFALCCIRLYAVSLWAKKIDYAKKWYNHAKVVLKGYYGTKDCDEDLECLENLKTGCKDETIEL